MTPSTKLTAKDIKSLPATIRKTVEDLQKRYRTRKVSLTTHRPDWQMYIAEGARYTVYHDQTGKSVGFQAQAEHSLHAGGLPISYMVGQRCPAFPVGTWVVEFELFCGTPVIEVHRVVEVLN